MYALTEKPAFKTRYSLRDQLERAAVSVSNNIAEGFERGTNQELLTFLYIARGSVGEVRSMLCLLRRIPAFCDLESEILNLKSRAESASKQTWRLDSVAARFRNAGPALREREDAPSLPEGTRPGGVPQGAGANQERW